MKSAKDGLCSLKKECMTSVNSMLQDEFDQYSKNATAEVHDISAARQYVEKFGLLNNEEYQRWAEVLVFKLENKTAAGAEVTRKTPNMLEDTVGATLANGVKEVAQSLKEISRKLAAQPSGSMLLPDASVPEHPASGYAPKKVRTGGVELTYLLEQMKERPTNPEYMELSEIIRGGGRWRDEAFIHRIAQLGEACGRLPLPATEQDKAYLDRMYRIVDKSAADGALSSIAEFSDENRLVVHRAHEELRKLALCESKNAES